MTRAIICYASYPDTEQWWVLARRRMEDYAERCHATFVHLESDRYGSVIDRGEIIADAVEQYERSLVIDADVIISRCAPDIFREFPSDTPKTIRMSLDSLPGDFESLNRIQELVALQAFFGPLGWTSGYHNAGVILCSGYHHHVFRDWKPLVSAIWVDQSNINYRARMFGTVENLPYCWNRFSLNSGHEQNTPDALEAILLTGPYIAHAAGHLDRQAAMAYLDRRMP